MIEWGSIVYPNEWVVGRLNDLCELITDGSHFSPVPQEDGEIIVNVKDMKTWGIDYDSCTKISKNDFDFLSKQNCTPRINDVLLSKDGTIGRVLVFKDNRIVILLSSIAILRSKPVLESSYLCTVLRSFIFDKQLYKFQSGSALKRLVLRDIQKLKIPYPPKNEQRKIARIIFTVDAVIEKTQAAIDKYKAIKQGMLHDLFTRGIDPTTGTLRPKYEDAPTLYKESKLGFIPLEWDEFKIKDCIDPVMSNVDKLIRDDETIILLCNYMDVYSNRYLTKGISYSIGSANQSEIQRFSLRPQDVMITKDSETPDDIAVPAVLVEKVENLICGYHLCILRSKDLNKLNGEFLMLQLQLQDINKQFAIRANGSTRYGLTIDAIENVFLKIPKNIDEQIEVVRRLKSLNDRLQAEQNYLQKLQMIKAGLMSDLLSGNKRVKVLEEVLAVAQ